MKVPQLLLRAKDKFVWADCEYVKPPPVVERTPLDIVELAEFHQIGIEADTLLALRAIRQTGDLSNLPRIVSGFLLAHSELKGKIAAVALPLTTTLSELKLSAQSLASVSTTLAHSLKAEIDLRHLRRSATVDDVVALIKNKLDPAQSVITREISLWAQFGGNPNQIDAGVMAYMAVEKWTATCKLGLVASNFGDFTRFIAEDEKADVSALIVLRHDQLPVFPIGVCLFHRTWTNNLFVDFLAGNPASLGVITGVGKALLHAVFSVGLELKVNRVWAETTSLSASVYEGIFTREKGTMGDQLEVSAAELATWTQRNTERWATLR